MAPKLSKTRVAKAIKAMEAMGFDERTVKPLLKNLLKLFDYKWAPIENESYHVLLDAIFEATEDKQKEESMKKEACVSHTSPEHSEPLPKKLHLKKKTKYASSASEDSNITLTRLRARNLKNHASKLEASRPPSKRLQSKHQKEEVSYESEGHPIKKPRSSKYASESSALSNLEIQEDSFESEEVPLKRRPRTKKLNELAPNTPLATCPSKDKHIQNSSEPGERRSHLRQNNEEGSSGLEEFSQWFLRLQTSPTDGNDLISIDGRVKFQNFMVVVEKIPRPISVNKLERLHCIVGVDRKIIEDIQGEGNKKIEVLKSLESYVNDITRGEETVKISLMNGISTLCPPAFFYIAKNKIYQKACVNFALANVEVCCSQCHGDCLASTIPCMCARESGTGFAYKPGGLVKDTYLEECISLSYNPQPHRAFCHNECPLERSKTGRKSYMCKGHLTRKFIKECWCKCGCSKDCGNRIVQKGITVNLQVFLTPEGKGWGLRTVEDLPKGVFVCEFVGEIVTSMELDERERERSGMHTYTVMLDAGWNSKGDVEDKKTLCLDATLYGNVARFINHRCSDANLAVIPVEVETPDHCYYHLALFTTRNINAMEELTWDYGIDFSDDNHVKAFECRCGSGSCRGLKHSTGTKCSSKFQDKEFLKGVKLRNIFHNCKKE